MNFKVKLMFSQCHKTRSRLLIRKPWRIKVQACNYHQKDKRWAYFKFESQGAEHFLLFTIFPDHNQSYSINLNNDRNAAFLENLFIYHLNTQFLRRLRFGIRCHCKKITAISRVHSLKKMKYGYLGDQIENQPEFKL